MQALLSVSVATKLAEEDPAFASIRSLNLKKMLLLSLGTGTNSEFDKTYTANETAKWGYFQWKSVIPPMLDASSSYMTDYYLSTVFQALDSQDNYLRVQVSPNSISIIGNLRKFHQFTILSILSDFDVSRINGQN